MNKTPPTTSKKQRAAKGERRNLLSFAPACVANTTKPTMTMIRKSVPLENIGISFAKKRALAACRREGGGRSKAREVEGCAEKKMVPQRNGKEPIVWR